MRSLKMSKERQQTLLRALQDAEDWQAGLKDAYTPETWNPDPPDFHEMRNKCSSLIKSYRELSGILFALGENK